MRTINRRTKSLNWIVDFPMAPDVSTATDWKMKRRSDIAYLALFLTSAASAMDPAASAMDPAASAARVRFEDQIKSNFIQHSNKQTIILIFVHI